MRHGHEERIGFITPFVGALLRFLTLPSRLLLGSRSRHLGGDPSVEEAHYRALRVDAYVLACFLIGVSLYFATVVVESPVLRNVALAFAVWRITDAVATTLRVTLFDHLELPRDREFRIASRERMIVLGMINFLELIFTFGTIYAAHPELLRSTTPMDMWDPLYFSAITQLMVGFGDILPAGPMRAVASIQSFVGPILIGLLITRFLAMLTPLKSLDR